MTNWKDKLYGYPAKCCICKHEKGYQKCGNEEALIMMDAIDRENEDGGNHTGCVWCGGLFFERDDVKVMLLVPF